MPVSVQLTLTAGSCSFFGGKLLVSILSIEDSWMYDKDGVCSSNHIFTGQTSLLPNHTSAATQPRMQGTRPETGTLGEKGPFLTNPEALF